MPPDSPRVDSENQTLDPRRDTGARRRTAREAERGSRRAALPWIVVPAVIVVVFVIGFGLRLVL
jgi:hypothetical protein